MPTQLEFEALYTKYSDKIYKYVYLNVSDPYLSEDIVSEVFLRVWKRWPTIRMDFIQALLYKIAKNIVVDFYRKKKNKRQMSLEDSVEKGMEPFYEQSFVDKVQLNDDIKRLSDELKLLPKNLRDVIILRFIEDLSAREVGQVLNISEVNVRVLQYRAIKKLKEVMNSEENGRENINSRDNVARSLLLRSEGNS